MMPSWFESFLLPGGRLGLTHSPGSREASRDQDLDALAALGVDHIICLQEACELLHYDPPETMDERRIVVEQRGFAFTHSPIVDHAAAGMAQADELVSLIDEQLHAGRTVIVHCWAGLGRAGTLAACFLTAHGMNAPGAITEVRATRPGAIQSDEQVKFIGQFASQHNK